MNDKRFIYMLRFTLIPGFHEKERFDTMIDFCLRSGIDDVMFFTYGEELNRGHMTMDEIRRWTDMVSGIKSKLSGYGITTSVNPWNTLLHANRGRTLREGQNFGLMMDAFGNTAPAVVCPLCPEWRQYIAEAYSCFAGLEPDTIWVEDDFRFHNHQPLVWGGCFCGRHMGIYSEQAGKKLSREDFYEGILRQGKPHPYRKIWLDTSRDTMVELAGIIGNAVHKVSPATRVGLMSSYPHVHCAEGRDWKGILEGLSGKTAMVNRPHLPAYTEPDTRSYLWDFSTISMLSRASVPSAVELYPELENWPFTRFSKSRAFTGFQLETSVCMNPTGITLDLFDLMGNGIQMQEGYQRTLAESKGFLTEIINLGLDIKHQDGVKILFDPGSSYTLNTPDMPVNDAGMGMTSLYPRESYWSGLLSCFGIANVFSSSKKHKDSCVAVSGQYFRNLSAGELKELFHDNFVIMDGEAAYTLFDMGFGGLADMKNAVWHYQDTGFQTFEQVCDGMVYGGVEEARMSAQVASGDYLDIKYENEPDLKAVVKNPFGETVGNGTVVIGGKVCVIPYGHFDFGIRSIHMHLCPARQDILQNILMKNKKAGCPHFVRGLPFVPVYSYDMGDKKVLIIINASGDDTDEIAVYAPGLDESSITEMNKRSEGFIKTGVCREGDFIILKSGLRNMETKVFIAYRQQKIDF